MWCNSVKTWRRMVLLVLIIMVGSALVGAADQTYQTVAWQAAQPPKIDGDLEEWNLTTPVVLERPDQVVKNAPYWDGPANASGRFYLMWDAENLYIGAQVSDDVPFVRFFGFLIDGIDALAVYLSTDPKSDPARTSYTSTDFRVVLAIDNDIFDTAIDRDMVLYRMGIDTQGMVGEECVLSGYEVAVTPNEGGYTFESKIPFANFSNSKIPLFRPRAGVEVGFSLELIDLDQACPGSEASWIGWTGRRASESPQNWGILRFEGK